MISLKRKECTIPACGTRIHFIMERNREVRSLAHPSDSVELTYRTDVKQYTSGHLNHNKLYKPSEKIKQGRWYSARKQTSFVTERNQFLVEHERTRKMKNCSGNFCSSIPLLPAQAESSFPNDRHPQSPVISIGASVDANSNAPEILKLKALKKKAEEGTDRFHMRLKSEELDMSEIMVLKNKPVKNSRQCAVELAKEEYQFIPSYLAGVTKTDQFNKFLQFQKEFIAKHELLQNDLTGKKVSEQHERKLAKELQKICGYDPLNFKRLQVVEEVFEDICNSSLIFGDILKEIKSEYELYIMMLLDSLPMAQYKALKAQVKGMETMSSKASEIQSVRKYLKALMKKVSTALERSKELKDELKIALQTSQTSEDKTETCRQQDTKGAQKPLSVSEQHESMRCKILSKWEEMKILETKKKETMVYAGITDNMENTLKEIEAETMKINVSNMFLQGQIKEVEGHITGILGKLRITQENQRKIWELIEKVLLREDEDKSF
ncbi:uncharacterized protein C6orf118 homolog isoform X1 [Anas platyrhynchos]|uniref:uncharacterized protein C6orf118 homolog isoform X1 n=2 Tax=Anas platyrhynchos TaxID=8839 RepID=UPI003AF30766